MSRRSPLAPLTLLVALVSVACQPGAETKKTDPKKVETKTETPPPPDEKRDPGTSLDKAVTAIDLAGPVPPETSAVFFAEDGALLPIACYLHDKKKLAGGKDCLKLVKAGDEVYLKSRSAENLDKVGGPKDTLCQSEGLSTPIVDGGAAFDYAVFPKSLARSVVMLPEDSWSEKKPALAAEEIAALTALAKVTGDLTIRQVALQDIDADGTPDKLVSVFQINPKDSERYTFAGVFVQRGSAPGTAPRIVFRGVSTFDGVYKPTYTTIVASDTSAAAGPHSHPSTPSPASAPPQQRNERKPSLLLNQTRLGAKATAMSGGRESISDVRYVETGKIPWLPTSPCISSPRETKARK